MNMKYKTHILPIRNTSN